MPTARRLSVPLVAAVLLFVASARLAASPPQPATAAGTVVPDQVVATLRRVLPQRIPNLSNIDEITLSPWPGMYEVRYGGTEIVYTDVNGQFLIQGPLIDTRTRANLTEQRIEKLTALDFSSLPLKDALVFKQGDGSRKMAVFADPNCGYCKRLERDLAGLNNVTIYVFLIPILGVDSSVKSRDIWCAADAPRAWRAWMLDGVSASKATEPCDRSVFDRNLAISRKHRITGTPALIFEDGTRKPGAVPARVVEELLSAAAGKKS